MVVICFDLFILRIYCARSTGKQCWPRWLHLHVCVLLQFECRLIGPQQLARVPRHRWWRRKCRSFWPHRGVVHPRGRRKDGHVISFRFFSFIRHHPQTHEACCQPHPILCWFLFGKPAYPNAIIPWPINRPTAGIHPLRAHLITVPGWVRNSGRNFLFLEKQPTYLFVFRSSLGTFLNRIFRIGTQHQTQTSSKAASNIPSS